MMGIRGVGDLQKTSIATDGSFTLHSEYNRYLKAVQEVEKPIAQPVLSGNFLRRGEERRINCRL